MVQYRSHALVLDQLRDRRPGIPQSRNAAVEDEKCPKRERCTRETMRTCKKSAERLWNLDLDEEGLDHTRLIVETMEGDCTLSGRPDCKRQLCRRHILILAGSGVESADQ